MEKLGRNIQLSFFDSDFLEQTIDKRSKEEIDSVRTFSAMVLRRINAICQSRNKSPEYYGLKHELKILQRSCEKLSYIRMDLLERIAEKMDVSLSRLLGERLRYEEQPKGYAVLDGKLYRIQNLSDLQHFLKLCEQVLVMRKPVVDERPVYIRRIEELCTNRQQLLEKMHISSARFSTILRQSPNLTLPMINRFADALGVSMVELFQEPEPEDFLATISCQLRENVRVVTRTFTRFDKLSEHCKEIEQTIEEMKQDVSE